MDRVAAALTSVAHATVMTGQAKENRFDVPGWYLSPLRQFQFGDLRIETPRCTLVVEAESAGGVTNLAKYWPLLRARPAKRFVLAHLFRVGSESDYIAHRKLWDFLVARMRDDLTGTGVRWPSDWEARLFCYRKPEETADLIDFLRSSCAIEDEAIKVVRPASQDR